MSNRTLKLIFDGQVEETKPIDTGIPQGSPISPILFLIYIRDLFNSSAVKFLLYIDDISLTVSSTSFKKNVKILEREAKKLYQLGEKNAIDFDLKKTELIHFSTGKGSNTPLTLPNGVIIQPKELVRWLGIWFDQRLSFKQHYALRISQGRSAFQRLSRLANTERGLSPYAVRQLYLACITSVADYGSIIWWKGQEHVKRPAQALQNLGLRKILGAFKTSPILPLEVEAALPPPEIRFSAQLRQYAFRILKLLKDHPIHQELNRIRSPHYLSRGPKTQLERIWESIQEALYDGPLEEIIPNYFLPWNRRTPYNVVIDPNLKEIAAENHLNQLQSTQGENIAIYSDASSQPNSKGIGVGLIAYQNGQPVYSKTLNISYENIVYNGELEGII